MIAIHTKFIGPTNTRGARIKAYTADLGDRKGFTATIPYPYQLSGEQCHFEAVKALVKKNCLDWNLDGMRYGDSADGRGFCYCFDCSKV
jgi:hypothetical protein